MAAEATATARTASSSSSSSSNGFAGFDLCPQLRGAIAALGFTAPTPVQREVVPRLLAGSSVAARARTGSGKTAAYLIPVLNHLLQHQQNDTLTASAARPRALVLVPTVDLADQTIAMLEAFCRYCRRVDHVNLCLRATLAQHVHALAQPLDFIVATPARLLEALSALSSSSSNNSSTNASSHDPATLLSALRYLVLDEADLLLSYGYLADIRRLLPLLPPRDSLQTVLLSATMGDAVGDLATRLLACPAPLDIPDAPGAEARAMHRYVVVKDDDERHLFFVVTLRLKLSRSGKVLVFTRSVSRAFRLRLLLETFGVPSSVLDPEASRAARQHALRTFGTVLIVPDDSLERGIDLPDVAVVVNFDFPDTPSAYVHRAGRTARAGKQGTVLSIAMAQDQGRVLDHPHPVNEIKVLNLLLQLHEQATQPSLLPMPPPTSQSSTTTSSSSSSANVNVNSKNNAAAAVTAAAGSSAFVSQLKPFDYSKDVVEGFKYRMQDAMRAISRRTIRDARAGDLRKELLNSEKLRSHFEDHAADLIALRRHDGPTAVPRKLPHLKHIPSYLGGSAAKNTEVKIKNTGKKFSKRRGPSFSAVKKNKTR